MTPDIPDLSQLAGAADLATPEQKFAALHAASHAVVEHRAFQLVCFRAPDGHVKLCTAYPDGTLHIHSVSEQVVTAIHAATTPKPHHPAPNDNGNDGAGA